MSVSVGSRERTSDWTLDMVSYLKTLLMALAVLGCNEVISSKRVGSSSSVSSTWTEADRADWKPVDWEWKPADLWRYEVKAGNAFAD
jgi:hypothetical protein